METKTTRRKITETAVGVGIGAVLAGPVGAVAGGLAAGHIEEGLEFLSQQKPAQNPTKIAADDPLIHVWPKRILVPLDFSLPSQRALRFAREWADFFAARVWLLHVVEPTMLARDSGNVRFGQIQQDILDRARVALNEWVRGKPRPPERDAHRKYEPGRANLQVCPTDLPLHGEFPDSMPVNVIVRKGKAFDQIATAARNIRADLIIIATQGHTGLKHMLLGSTAERVARHAPCPVLVLRRRPRP